MARQLVDFPLTGATQEEPSSKILPAPALVRAENCWRVKSGALEKRRGTDQIATGEVGPSQPKKVIKFGDELLVLDNEDLYAITAENTFRNIEDATSVTLDDRDVLAVYGSHNVIACACGASTQIIVYAWSTTDGTNYRLHVMVREIGGSVVTPATEVPLLDQTGRVDHIKCVQMGSQNVAVVWGEPNNRIRALLVTPSDEGPYESGDILDLATDADQTVSNWFDCDGHNVDELVLAYVKSTAVDEVQLKRYNASFVVQSLATVNASNDNPRLGIVGRVNNIHLHIQHDGASPPSTSTLLTVKLSDALANTGSQSSGPGIALYANKGMSSGRFDATQSIIALNVEINSRPYVRIIVTNGTSAGFTSGNVYQLQAISKPWGLNDRVYLATQFWGDQANSHTSIVSLESAPGTYDLIRSECRFNSARAPEDLATDVASTIGRPYDLFFGSTNPLKNTRVIWPVRSLRRISSPNLTGDPTDAQQVVEQIGVDAFSFNFNSKQQYISAELGGTLYLGGGMVCQYDGRRLTEVGFFSFPDVTSADILVDDTGNMLDGAYIYGLCWEWHDALGRRHQSAVRLLNVSVSQGNLGRVRFAIRSHPETRKYWRRDGSDAQPYTCAIYRTEANGGVLYRLEGPGVAQFPEIDSQNENVQYSDTYNEDAIALTSREILYTSAAGAQELDNVPPPPSKVIISHDGRLFGIDDTDPTRIWYSKALYEGFGLAWNESLIVQLDEPAHALVSQDGNLIVFCENALYAVRGQPADNTGRTTSYDPPQRLSTEVGCTNHRSVVTSPGGVFFASPEGVYLLPRGGLDPIYAGVSVEDTFRSYPFVSATLHDPADTRVLFACCDQEGPLADSRILAYNYQSKEWFVWDYGDEFYIASLAMDGPDMVACSFGVWGSEDHFIFTEDDGYDDSHAGVDSWVTPTIETGDIRPGGPNGTADMAFVFLLGEAFDAATVRIEESHDSGATYSHYRDFSVTTAEREFARRYQTISRKVTTSRYRITQSPYSGQVDSRGVSLNALSLEISPITGGRLLPAGSRA